MKTFEETKSEEETKSFKSFKFSCGVDEGIQSCNVKKVNEGGKTDYLYKFNCKKVAKRGGFTQRRYTKLSKPGEQEGCQPDEFMCGAQGKHDGEKRLFGLQCCYGDNIEVNDSPADSTEEIVTITETTNEIKSSKDPDAVCTSFEMM